MSDLRALFEADSAFRRRAEPHRAVMDRGQAEELLDLLGDPRDLPPGTYGFPDDDFTRARIKRVLCA